MSLLLMFIIFHTSCEKEIAADPCDAIVCQTGTCVDGVCMTVQERLDGGETPMSIYESDKTLLDSLYGKEYVGGIIFYLNTNNGNGMVAAKDDLDSYNCRWGCNDTDISNLPNVPTALTGTETAEGAKIGDGATNTQAIIASCSPGYFPAGQAADYNGGGYTDWFLPSRGELNEMFQNIDLPYRFGYWSSTEKDATQVWIQEPASDPVIADKAVDNFRCLAIRPARAF